jgi:hypothetical protein
MINDYIFVQTAQVIDLAVNVKVVLDNQFAGSQTQGAVITKVSQTVAAFLDPKTQLLGQNVNVSKLKSEIQNVEGVLSLTEIKFFNKVGGEYSSDETSQSYVDDNTKEIGLINETIYALPTQIYQVRKPTVDITVQVAVLQTTNIS